MEFKKMAIFLKREFSRRWDEPCSVIKYLVKQMQYQTLHCMDVAMQFVRLKSSLLPSFILRS